MSIPADRPIVAIDLETTGLSPDSDRIVEIGAARFDASGADLGTFQSLVNPLRPVSPQARSVHGITDEELRLAPAAESVLPAFLSWLSESHAPPILIAHNASFDAAFLGRALARGGIPATGLEMIDTLPLARVLRPDAPNHRLDTLVALYRLASDGAHRALADAVRLKGLWLALTGGGIPPVPLVAYPIADPAGAVPVPSGWDRLAEAMAGGATVRMEYAGGSRGTAPREITPRRFAHHGGVAYVVALCHAESLEKSFRLDRIVRFEALDAATRT